MKTAIMIGATLAIWVALAVTMSWLSPSNKECWERMEEMMNDGAKTSLRQLGLGAVSIATVVVLAQAFGFF
jgi:uncharacterized protein YjeT (DUF2065 family)